MVFIIWRDVAWGSDDVGRGRVRTVLAAAVAVGVAVVLGGCLQDGRADSADAGGRLRVVATTPVVADFVRNIGGDAVSVRQILAPNVDPHDYEPSPADIAAIARADVLVKNGAGLEGWLDSTIDAAGFHGLVVDASTNVTIHHSGGEPDPHIWHDPHNAMIMVRDIAAGLSGTDPGHRATFQSNLDAYLAKLAALDGEIRSKINRIPPGQRELVTNHDALGYYVSRYGLRFVGSVIPSFDSSAELSGKDIERIVDLIRATGTKAVFSEASLPAKTAQTIAREAGVKVVAGEDALYADSLGPAGSAGATYLAMERHNTDVIVDALS